MNLMKHAAWERTQRAVAEVNVEKRLFGTLGTFGSTVLACFAVLASSFAEAQPAASASGPPIFIGQVLPLTGPLAQVGKDIQAATKAHFDWLNQRGGIAGRRLELITVDDANDAKNHTAAATTLVKEKNVVALLNCFGTVGCLAGAGVAKSGNTPLVGPIAGAPSLRGPDMERVFTVRPGAELEVGHLVDYINRIGLTRVALFVQDDGFGRGYLPPALAALKARNLNPVSQIIFAPATPDYANLAMQLTNAKVDAVVMLANVSHSANLIKAVRASSGNPYFLNLAGQANGGFVKALQGQSALAAFAAFTPNPWSEKVAVSKEYREAWKTATTEENYSFLTLEAYLNAKLLTTALARTGRSVSRDNLAQALAAMRNTDLGGFSVGYPAGRSDASNFVDLAVMNKSGRFVQ
jgi:branched-chain amino acid transport system substrate-binding protein